MNLLTSIRLQIKLVSLISAAFLIVSCGSDGAKDKESMNVDSSGTGIENAAKDTNVKNIIYSMPSPLETATMIQNSGAPYNKDLLNDVNSAKKYTSTNDKALNLGVYGTDLSYTSIYDQTQESMLFLKCANFLATGLGISGSFDDKTADRLDANKNNRDSLLTIITESFWTADSYLKENERPGTSALIVTGGWIEGLYIASQIAKNTKNEEIVARVAEQKFNLTNILGMLKKYEYDDKVNALVVDLKDLQKDFDGITVTKSTTETTTDTKTGVTSIGGGNKLAMTTEQLNTIIDKASKIRNKVVSK